MVMADHFFGGPCLQPMICRRLLARARAPGLRPRLTAAVSAHRPHGRTSLNVPDLRASPLWRQSFCSAASASARGEGEESKTGAAQEEPLFEDPKKLILEAALGRVAEEG
jgi:hypothetical protein